jgi:hypothetical protein
VYVIQVRLPLCGREGAGRPEGVFRQVEAELVERFGRVTAYLRKPAKKRAPATRDPLEREELVVFEVLARDVDRSWWGKYRRLLAKRFA